MTMGQLKLDLGQRLILSGFRVIVKSTVGFSAQRGDVVSIG